jgi:tetratricopeptide (TPR) repeat protein
MHAMLDRGLIVCTGVLIATSPALAQRLPLKTTLAAGGASGCAAYAAATPVSAAVPADDPETRRLISDGQEAALQGEHGAARDAFTKAAQRAPSNARLAYYLGREHEALNEGAAAVRAYCRYLALLPNAPDGDEVRGRVVRLVPTSELARVDEQRANFRSGVALLQRREFVAADSVFGSIIRQLPTASEAFYDRGLARAARGVRGAALEDFEKYLELTPNATDRPAVRTAMARLPDRVYSSSSALASGLIVPGLGQMSTGRPVLGVAVLGAVAGVIAFGLVQKDVHVTRQCSDPFGNPYDCSFDRSERPYFVAASVGAAGLWVGAAYESMRFARNSRARAESIIAAGERGASHDSAPVFAIAGVTVAPVFGRLPKHGMVLGVSVAPR